MLYPQKKKRMNDRTFVDIPVTKGKSIGHWMQCGDLVPYVHGTIYPSIFNSKLNKHTESERQNHISEGKNHTTYICTRKSHVLFLESHDFFHDLPSGALSTGRLPLQYQAWDVILQHTEDCHCHSRGH